MSDKHFDLNIRIYYEDTDTGGVVYYANYLKFMERARTEWLRHLGFEQDQLIEKEKIIFAVRKVQIDYQSPARFNDEITITTMIADHSKVSIEFSQQIKKQNVLLCHGQVMIACLNSETFKPTRMPNRLLQELEHVNNS